MHFDAAHHGDHVMTLGEMLERALQLHVLEVRQDEDDRVMSEHASQIVDRTGDVGAPCDDWGMTSLSDFSAATLSGEERDLSDYDGKVVLVVNTASKCGFTPQYAGLEHLWKELGEEGLVVLGFPCNQFRGQEPGEAAEIEEFCQVNYGVTFPMFAKVDVNGDDAHPVFQWLKSEKKGVLGGRVKWNFTKFLVGRDGQVIDRYAPNTEPSAITDDIRAALAVQTPPTGSAPPA